MSLVTAVVLLAGCAARKAPVAPVVSDLAFDAEISYRGAEYAGRVEVGAGGVFTVELLRPQTLAGLTLRWDGDEYTVDYLGLQYQSNAGSALFSEVFGTLRDVLAAAAAGQPPADGNLLEGKLGATAYQLFLTDEGLPQRLLVPAADLTVDFRDVRIVS